MLRQHESYLEEIELTRAGIGRVKRLLDDFSSLVSEPQALFISDTYDDKSIRRHLNIWIVSNNFISECKNFLINDNIDFISLGCVKYIEVTKENLGNPEGEYSTNSKYKLHVMFTYPGSGEFSAVGNNCQYLHSLLVKYIMPAMA